MRIIDIARKRRGNKPFELLSNGITIRLKANYPAGTTGQADGDSSGKIYTAVDNTMLNAMDPLTDDYTTVCTTLVTDMRRLFQNTAFNQNISSWDTANVTDMKTMFEFNYTFNQDISNWDVSNVTSFMSMFRGFGANKTIFNQSLNTWDTSSAIDMVAMFEFSEYNQPLNNWNVSNVTDMERMFKASFFNQPLENWNVVSVTKMFRMFESNTVFNQDISNWNTSNVINMNQMFRNASNFNQDLSTWCVEQIPTEPTDFDTGATSWTLPKPNWGATC